MPGVTCSEPTAAFYVMPKVALQPGRTDEEHALLARPCARRAFSPSPYGSGFGMNPADGYLRIVFLASPEELREIYRLMAAFTSEYLAGNGGHGGNG